MGVFGYAQHEKPDIVYTSNKKSAEATQPADPPAQQFSERARRKRLAELIELAQMLAARGIVPRTTDELVAANHVTADSYNAVAARIRVDVRLQVCGPALPDAPPPKFYDWVWSADGWGLKECQRAVDAYRTEWRAIVEAGRRDIADRLAMFNSGEPRYWPGPRGGAWAILGRPYEPPPRTLSRYSVC
jgi:hypothetical protein